MTIEALYKLFESCNYTVCTDTRNLKEGSLFIALSGANFNGNEFLETALQKGCKAVIGDDPKFAGADVVIVDDSLKTLQKLANYHRLQFDIPVLAVTGTNGKTTTKELLAAVLQTKYELLYTKGNLNNHIGVPLTLLEMKPHHNFALIEMGANKLGDIDELCQIAEPNYGLVTNVGKAHLEGFGDFEGVKSTKAEMFKSLVTSGGTVFINNNEPFLNEMLGNYNHVIHYGIGTYSNAEIKANQETLTITIGNELIKTQLHGKYNSNNVLTAYAVGLFFNLEKAAVVNALQNYEPSNNRSQILKTVNGNKLILDAYNANPTSLGLALNEFSDFDKNQRLAIIGEMRELGSASYEEHRKVWDFVKNAEIQAYFVGKAFSEVRMASNVYNSVEELINSNELKTIKNYTVLIKGSRGVRLEEVVKHL